MSEKTTLVDGAKPRNAACQATYMATTDETAVKAAGGQLFGILIGETAAGAITVYDGTVSAGTLKATLKASIAEGFYPFCGAVFETSITIKCAAATKLTALWA